MGNIGQSAAVFLGPVLAATRRTARRVLRRRRPAASSGRWRSSLLARDAPRTGRRPASARCCTCSPRERLSWALSRVLLPDLRRLRRVLDLSADAAARTHFGLTPADADSAPPASWSWPRCCGRWAACSPTASAARACCPACSSASCRSRCCWPGRRWCRSPSARSAARRCSGSATAPCSSWCRSSSPRNTGTVTGLVGAMGGLGGFFPPLLLGFFRDRLGVVWPGFVLLAARRRWRSGCSTSACSCPRQKRARRPLPPAHAPHAPTGCAPAPGRRMATGAAGRRDRRRLAQPAELRRRAGRSTPSPSSSRRGASSTTTPSGSTSRPRAASGERGLELLRARAACCAALARRRRAPAPPISSRRPSSAQRSRLRWWMHQCLFWGCLLAVAITFPLVFGWIHFRTAPGRPDDLRHLPVRLPDRLVPAPHASSPGCCSTASTSPRCWCSPASRSRSGGACATAGALALQDFAHGLPPAHPAVRDLGHRPGAHRVARCGCAARFYGFLAILHAITVIAALLYLPFGKFFHIFQRPAQLGVKLYQDAGERGRGRDLRALRRALRLADASTTCERVLPAAGFDYRDRRPGRALAGPVPALQAQRRWPPRNCASRRKPHG